VQSRRSRQVPRGTLPASNVLARTDPGDTLTSATPVKWSGLPRGSRTVGPLKMRVLLESEIQNMTASRRRFSQEFKDELCQEVIATSKPIKEVAVAYGVGPETLRNWLIKYRDTHGGTETELTVDERARLKELERVVQDLRAETAFLKKASAYFAREQRQ